VIKSIWIFVLSFLGIFIIDQNIKHLFINGFSYYGNCISLILTYNRGVAFSLFAFLGENLKYIQLLLISLVVIYMVFHKKTFTKYSLPLGIILGAGSSNIYDRFIYGGVVDYVYWHCGFNFAIFNFADVMIDFGVLMILYLNFKNKKYERG